MEVGILQRSGECPNVWFKQELTNYRAQIHFGISGAASSLAVLTAAFTVPQASDVTKKYLLLLPGLLLSNAIYTFAIS